MKAKNFKAEGSDNYTLYLISARKLLGSDATLSQMYKNLQWYTATHFRICNAFQALYFRRDPKTFEFYLDKNPFRLGIVKLNVFLHLSYTLITTTYFLSTMSYNKISEKMLAFSFIAAWAVCGLMQTELWKRREEAIFMYRSIIEFENRYLPEKKPKQKQKLDSIFSVLMVFGIVSCFGLPGMMTEMLLVDPCKPPHLGYILFKKSYDVCVVPGLLPRFLVLGADVYLWIIALPHGLFYMFQGLLVGIRRQDYYLRLLQSGFKKCHKWAKVRDEVSMKIYRELEIMNRLFNNVFQPAFFPGVIAVGLIVAIMGIFAVLKLHDKIPFPAKYYLYN